MHWRLGLDIGTNSIGWAAFFLDSPDKVKARPIGLLDSGSGVRTFSDGRNPKDMQSLAATRRGPRGMRRRRDRYLKRRERFMEQLIAHGLMPADPAERKALEKQDPWALRARALDEELSPHELGRALFHLQQRRGFKSNRKTDTSDSDKGAIKDAVQKLDEQMTSQGARTLGELLGRPRLARLEENSELPKNQRRPMPGTRARPKAQGNKNIYDFYPTRDLIAHEFEAIWKKQKEFHGERLTDAAYENLKCTLLFQRDLKPQPVGKCVLTPTEQRAPRALPSVQRFRIYQEINNLKVRLPGEPEKNLTVEHRDKLAAKLTTTGKLEFKTIRNTLLKLPDDARFNLESLKRKHLDGDRTAAVLAAEGKSPRWGKAWHELSEGKQDAIVEILLGQERGGLHFESTAKSVAAALDISKERAAELLETTSEEVLTQWLVSDFGLDEKRAVAVVTAPLPDGHANLGRTAIGKVLEWLASDTPQAEWIDPRTGVKTFAAPFTYDQSVVLAGYPSHSMLDGEGGGYDMLPYYGEVLERHVAFGTGEPDDIIEKRIGKLANPTVHVALNQVRRVINALIERYGAPTQIVVELARDLPLSAKGKSELERDQAENQKANEERRKILEEQNTADTYENRLKLRLWEELNPDNPLDRKCPYSGNQIGIETLLSSKVDIDHILPFSRTLDDSAANKTVCFREANRFKENKSPYEAFASSPNGYDWEWISEHAVKMPSNKSWRFGPDAMERYENDERGFLARQLNETRYIARLTKTYLECIGADVWVTPGRLTADLRWTWGLDSILPGHNVDQSEFREKNRNDHRNHAIDAIVVGLTDRALLNEVAKNAGRAEQEFTDRLFADLPDPWPNFRDTVRKSIELIVVSHKSDHGIEGALHEDTAYGVVKDPETGEERLASRKPLVSLTRGQIGSIGDLGIRMELLQRTEGLSGKDLQSALEAYSKETGVRRVRVHKVEAAYEVIRHGGEHRKAVIPGENFCVDIVDTPDGQWRGVGVTRFQVNKEKLKGGGEPAWKREYPDARHVMRVHKDDLLKLERDGKETVMQVVRLNPSGNRFYLVEHFEAGDYPKRHENGEDDFRWDLASFSRLKERKTRLVHVDPAGGVKDPGPPI